jgi:hypothetical protein
MLHVIVDDLLAESKDSSKDFYSLQTWQMNVMNAINHAQGVAKFVAAQKGLPDGNWLLARPIYWQATHNDVMIVADCQQGFSDDHMKHYFEVFQGFLERDGYSVYRLEHHLWLFDANSMPTMQSVGLNDVMHQSLQTFIQQMPVEWRTWFTEVQMLFHGLPAPGPYPVNGVWVFGGGEPPNHLPLTYMGDFHLPEYENWNAEKTLKSGDVLLVSKDKQQILNEELKHVLSGFHEVHWWWNNQHYTVSKPSIWSKIKNWISHEN